MRTVETTQVRSRESLSFPRLRIKPTHTRPSFFPRSFRSSISGHAGAASQWGQGGGARLPIKNFIGSSERGGRLEEMPAGGAHGVYLIRIHIMMLDIIIYLNVTGCAFPVAVVQRCHQTARTLPAALGKVRRAPQLIATNLTPPPGTCPSRARSPRGCSCSRSSGS